MFSLGSENNILLLYWQKAKWRKGKLFTKYNNNYLKVNLKKNNKKETYVQQS